MFDPIFQLTFKDIKHCWAQYWSLGFSMCARLKRRSFPPLSVSSPSEGCPPTTRPSTGGGGGKLYWKLWKNPGRHIHHLTHINRGGYLGNLQVQICSYVGRQISPLRQKHGVLPTKNKTWILDASFKLQYQSIFKWILIRKLLSLGSREWGTVNKSSCFCAEKLKNTIHMYPRSPYWRKHIRVGFATFCCRGEFAIPYSRDWGKTHNSYENLLLWHWNLPLSSWLFSSSCCKRKEVNPTMHENILKGSCNFLLIYKIWCGGWRKCYRAAIGSTTLEPRATKTGNCTRNTFGCAISMFISLYSYVRKMKAIFCSLSFKRIESLPVLQWCFSKHTKFNRMN